MKIRTYSELIELPTFEERYLYLQLNGAVGKETFGFDRYLNQMFYRSKEWKDIKDSIVVRDGGRDLALPGYEIWGRVYIHHMNPITPRDIAERSRFLFDPEYLVCVSLHTHNAIHYGDANLLPQAPVERRPNDTCPWKSIL